MGLCNAFRHARVSTDDHDTDKGYILTDCISMQTIERQGLVCALTNDRHLEQDGFRALFRP